MKKQLLKSMLVGAMTLVASSAWADYKTVVKYSFDDKDTPALTAGSRASLDYTYKSVISGTTFLNIWGANNNCGATSISLGNTDLTEETWTLSFYWAGYSGCNKKSGHTYLKAGDTNLFDIADAADWGSTMTLTYGSSTVDLPVAPCNKSTRISAKVAEGYNTTDYWFLFTVEGSSSGVNMTVKNANSGNVIVDGVELTSTKVNPTSIAINPGSCGGVGIDELLLTYYVEGEVIQTPAASITKVDGIYRTVTATCDTEGTTLYYSIDEQTNWNEGTEITVSESCNIYFKAVKGASESDVLTFAVTAGEPIVLNTPTINRTSETSFTISADQSKLLLSPDATIYYTFGEETGSFTGSKTFTIEGEANVTAYAEFEGYTTSENASREVALFPEYVNTIIDVATQTKGWSTNTFSSETITASERTYAALLLDDTQWGNNVYLQTDGAWGLRANGNWYINSNTDDSWILLKDVKKGDIAVIDVTYAPSSTVNADYAEKYSFGTKYAYIIAEDGDAEFAVKKASASEMDYLYGVYSYRAMDELETAKAQLTEDIAEATALNAEADDATLKAAIDAAQAVVDDADATLDDVEAASQALEDAVAEFNGTTGISAVAAAKEQGQEVYNLAGQRVAKAQKGLYIVNGKKVIR